MSRSPWTPLWLILAALPLQAATVEFGSAVVGSPATAVINLSSQDSSALNVTALNFSDPRFSVVSPQPPFTVPGNGGQLAITLQFVPTKAGEVLASVTVVDAPHPSQTYSLHGIGVTGSVTGPTVDFGTVTLGSTSTSSFNLSDPNSTPLNVTGLNTTNSEFTAVTPSLPFTINPGAQQSVTMRFTPLTTGLQTSVLTVVSAGAQNSLLNLTGVGQAGPPPQINANGISNAAVAKTILARGALASVYGLNFAVGTATFQAQSLPLPPSLGGVSIKVGGVDAPLYFVSSGQINFQVPFEVSGTSANVVVTVNGAASPPVPVTVADYAVGIFGYARTASAFDPIILHLDNSFVTPAAPALPGETLVLYATGIGKLNNAPGDGAAASASPLATAADTPTVTVGGLSAQVIFAGLTPGGVGLSQFDITLPSSLPSSATGTLPLLIGFPGDSGPPVNLAVTAGSLPLPKLTLSSNSLGFGSVAAGQTSTLSMTLSNTGTAALTIREFDLSGTGYTLVSPPTTPLTVAPAGRLSLSIQFAPAGTGPSTGSLSIVSDDAASPAVVSLTGTGIPANAPVVSASLSTLDFGAVITGQTKDATVIVNNTGSATLTVSGLSTAAPFSVVSPTAPFNVSTGASTVVTIHFAPATVGPFSSALTISSNDPAKPALSVALTGSGVAPGAPVIGVSATSVAFGTVTVSQTKAATIVVNNTGNASLTVTALNAAAPFSVTSPATPFNVAAGASVNVALGFTPTAATAVTGTLTISSNDAVNPALSVALTGTGSPAIPLACGFVLGPDIYAKWVALGGQGGVLGCAVADETEAMPSPQKTTGRMAPFNNGLIYWHRDGPFAGQAHEVHGCALGTYIGASSSAGVLGFPVTDQLTVDGGFRNDFQGGYILTASGINVCSEFAAGTDYTGTWTSDRGSVILVQDNFTVSGTYAGTGTITGLISGTTLSLSWSDSTGQGSATFSIASNGAIWTGTYSKQGFSATNQWNGTRSAGGTPGWITPSRIDFGNVPLHNPKTLNIVASEPGSSPLTIQQFSTDNPAFQVTVGAFTILPGGSTTIPIRFTPALAGPASANITISTLDPARPDIIVKVSGVGQ